MAAVTSVADGDRYPSRRESAPRWIARQEPAIYSRWDENAPLSREEHESFDKNGFLVINEVFDAQELAVLMAELERLRTRPQGVSEETIIHEPDGGAVRSIFAVHRQSPVFRRLASDARLVSIARYILGDDIYVHQSRLNYKPGFRGKEFYWHSDFETWHVEDGMPAMRAISASILLTENTALNGPLMLMPGSHKHFVACVGETPEDHYRKSLRRQEYGVPDPGSLTTLADRNGIVAPVGAAGTVILFDCNTMHGSNGNITPMARANAFLVYNALSNSLGNPYGAPKPRPEFVASRRYVEPLKPVSGVIGPGQAP